MITSVRFARGRAVYTGRLARAPFSAWLQTADGRNVITAASCRIRFSLLGKTRAAQRRLWRDLSRAAGDARVAAVIQRELDEHFARPGTYAYANGLPRLGIELHRLVVVPRVLINAALFAALSRALANDRAFAGLDAPTAMTDFFALSIVSDADRVLADMTPSPACPVPAGPQWLTVGLNRAFVWRGPALKEPPWPGHHYVFEVTRDPVTRRVRNALTDGIKRLEASLPSLTQLQRADILRRAHRA